VRRILITGKNGQVGWELQRTLMTLGQVIAVDRTAMDLADLDSVRRGIREIKPDIIVNAAAYTAVDKAESEPELAMAINGVAPGIIAEEAKRLGAAVIHYSTDYVFDGTKDRPYTEDDEPNPLNVYGRTKLVGERAIEHVGVPHLIFRTSWVYGTRVRNFLLTIMRLAKEREELRIVNDQFGTPTWSRTIAESTAQIVAQLYCPFTARSSPFTGVEVPITHHSLPFTEVNGIYHLTASGQTSWHGFAKAIVELQTSMAKSNPHLTPISTTEYPTLATRPRYSVMSNSRLKSKFGLQLPEWNYGLGLCAEELPV